MRALVKLPGTAMTRLFARPRSATQTLHLQDDIYTSVAGQLKAPGKQGTRTKRHGTRAVFVAARIECGLSLKLCRKWERSRQRYPLGSDHKGSQQVNRRDNYNHPGKHNADLARVVNGIWLADTPGVQYAAGQQPPAQKMHHESGSTLRL